ncbi:hypothetical protein [Vibrio sp. 10N.239.312.D08]|uniref:hypothetical protein n=1 Tax=Vibrio sp. 10N.239.312.D08 TaxID=3229978 RepID=UPI0035537425
MNQVAEPLKFINWQDLGEIVEQSAHDTAFVTVKDYALVVRAKPENRVRSASQELMALSKIFKFNVIQGKPNQYPFRVLEAVFWTVFVTAEERDKILEASRPNASKKARQEANDILDTLMVEPPKFLLN